MPTIEITQAQQDALDRGERVVIAPRPKRLVAVGKGPQDGEVYLITRVTADQRTGKRPEVRGRAVHIRTAGIDRPIVSGRTTEFDGVFLASAFTFTEVGE